MTFVMVYGTLKRDYGNHGVLGDSEYISEAITKDTFTMYDGGFPFVSDSEDKGNKGHVKGEIYRVEDENAMRALDRLEGVPHMYVRKSVDAWGKDGNEYTTIMYVASEDTNSYLTEEPMTPVNGVLEWRSGGQYDY